MGTSAGQGRVRRAGGGRRFLRNRFLGDRRGATAVEFALVAPIFLALLGATLETALAFWSNQILETALTDASRQLYTGQFQAANKATTDKTQLLNKLRAEELCKVNGQPRATIFDCTQVKIDVRTVSQFTGSSPTAPVNPATKDWSAGFGTNYSNPNANEIIIVQAAVKFPVYFTLLNPNQASFSDGSRLLQAAVAFKTEPF
jgi:Flp pilus assembly protein TadG